MRISDWSSDVCSSDLCPLFAAGFARTAQGARRSVANGAAGRSRGGKDALGGSHLPAHRDRDCAASRGRIWLRTFHRIFFYPQSWPGDRRHGHPRSEEHTSELQSLMRNSYAVFCLKKKNKPKIQL